MKNKGYGQYLSEVYDRLNSDVNSSEWADYCETCFDKFAKCEVKHICEIACGTGSVSVELEKRGYKLTSSDLSEDMLSIADNKAFEAGCRNVVFAKQDMCSFTASNKAGAVICLLDSVNCLLTPKSVKECFSSAHDILVDGGIFVFDVNSKYKFEKVYADNAYVLEDEGVLCAWQNFYDQNKRICDFYLSFFIENDDGTYSRHDEENRERMYTEKSIKAYLKEAGFSDIYVFGGFDFSVADENVNDRLHFVARRAAAGNFAGKASENNQ